MGLRGEIIVDYERILVKEISKRFKKLRGKTPYGSVAKFYTKIDFLENFATEPAQPLNHNSGESGKHQYLRCCD